MSGPPRGHIRLYSAIRPALLAGTYRLRLDQNVRLAAGDVRALPRHEQELELTAPRFRMSGTELYSVFPPPFAEGPFSNRFAQAVLKRRTLPWERDPGPGSDGRRTPWLALVVLAGDEGLYRPDLPLTADDLAAYRAGIGLSAAAAGTSGTCDVLEVTGRTVRKAFPTVDDLPYLTHVREVNLLDDDGFVAVVASSRVLRGGQSYGAYLISVEGQLAVLPDAGGATADEIGPSAVPPAPQVRLPHDIVSSAASRARDAARAGLLARAAGGPAGTGLRASDASTVRERLAGWGLVDDLDGARKTLAEHGLLADAGPRPGAGPDVAPERDDDFVPGDRDLHRFPVLAQWTFTTIQDGDFETLMRGLDVGLLGTVRGDADDPPTVLATGHNLLTRHARTGERTAAWYRGPLVPHELDDRDDVPLHAAEQAIRIGRDGIEDLSYAAAFELGRLLALADPRFVSALVGWRRSGSTRSWGRLRRENLLLELIPPLELEKMQRYLSFGLIERLLGGDGGLVDPLGPLVNPVPLRETYDPAADAAALERIGLRRDVVADALGLAAAPSGFGPAVVDAADLVDTRRFDDVVRAGGPLAAELGAQLDAVWRREVGHIADMGDVP